MAIDTPRRTDTPTTPHHHDPRATRIWVAWQTLKGHGDAAEIIPADPTALTITVDDDVLITVRCDHRASCGGELWFYFPGGYPIAPADDAHLHELVVAVKGKVAERT